MRRSGWIRIPLVCLAFLVGLVVLIQLVLNVGIVSSKLHKLCDENIDGKVDWSSLFISIVDDFPSVTVLVKGLDIAYPADTSLFKAHIDRVKVVSSVWTLLEGCADVGLTLESGALNLGGSLSASELFSEDPHFKLDAGGVHSGVPGGRTLPDFLSERDFRENDVNVEVDTSILKFIDDWSPSGHLRVSSGRFASTQLPLRTRLGAMDLKFREGNIDIDTLQVRCGSSDISINGTIRSMFRFLKHRGALEMDACINSNRLNVNELVTAFQNGEVDVCRQTAPSDEEYEGFVTDKYSNSDLKVDSVKLLVIPANLKADIRVNVNLANVSRLDIKRFGVRAQVGERTAKLSALHAITSLGSLNADAFG